ncbi:MAG: gamma-glutamyltransferase family protein [bacterium]
MYGPDWSLLLTPRCSGPVRRLGCVSLLLLLLTHVGVTDGLLAADFGSPPVVGEQVMVVTAHPLASEVGVQLLRDGGNAVDAAVGAALALAVVEPYGSGLGGGGFLVTFRAVTGSVRALDCREKAPAAASRDMYLVNGEADLGLSQSGPLAVAVPGLVHGLWVLHQEEGRLPWDRLVRPAASLARDGFPVSAMLLERIEYHRDRFNDAARAIFLPNGQLPVLGQILVQTDLVATLEAIAHHGPDAFYTGPVAEAMVATLQAGGGLLTLSDLADYHPRWREPVTGTYHGLTIHSMPPPSSGGVFLMQMLNILARDALADPFRLEYGQTPSEDEADHTTPPCLRVYDDAAYCHLLAEAMKFAYADRSLWLGDPDYFPVPVARLTSRAYADSLRGCVDPDTVLPWQSVGGVRIQPVESSETTHLSVVDGEGNGVAATLTINLNFGSGWVATGTGVLLNDEMDDFVAAPGVPNAFGLVGAEANAIAAGKRPLSSMTPTIVLRDGEIFMVTGSPGGSRIITTVLQTILNVVDHDLDVAAAVAAPRIHHQWQPPVLYYEPFGMSRACAYGLEARGHTLVIKEAMGNAQVIVVDPVTGILHGAGDPRGMGQAAGY